MQEKPKLEVLDALRGFCALAIVLLHMTELTAAKKVIPHGHLPVAYFFLLTGFMFAYVYDGRWDRMGVRDFLKRRFWRLHPLAVIGAFVGFLAVLAKPAALAHYPVGGVTGAVLMFLYCATMLPAPTSWGAMHVLQGPLWTMQYIYLANILYAFVLRHLKTWMLAVLTVAAAALTVWMSTRHPGLKMGWLFNWDHVSVALTRMSYPVLLGMVIGRLGWRIPSGRAALPVCVAALAAMFFCPNLGSANEVWFTAAVILLAMPLVVLVGAGGTIANVRVASVCRFLGKFSFPLYTTHFAFRGFFVAWYKANRELPVSQQIAAGLAYVALMFAVAYLAMKAVDAFDAWRKERVSK